MPIIGVAAQTGLAMIAFVSSSILCSMALKDTGINSASFTSIRLVSGAAVFWAITFFVVIKKEGATYYQKNGRSDTTV